MHKWGIPKDCESFAIDTLQKRLKKVSDTTAR